MQESDQFFFSDGSCFGNTTPGMSLAAWALVLGLATTSDEIARVEGLGNDPPNLSSWFLTVAVDRCHGEQTIDRAELWAMLKLHERWKRTTLITDSEYAKSSWHLVQQVTHEQQLIFRPNADLLIRLRRAQVGADHEVIKVQSHQLDGKTPTTSQRFYHTLGNMVVDTIAKQTNQMLSMDMVQQWQAEHADILQQQTIRKAHYDLLLDIQPVRATLEHNSRTTRSLQMMLPTQDNPHIPLAQLLEQWSPDPCYCFELFWPADVTLASPWGEEIMVEMIQWWNALQWPVHNVGEINRSGVTWAELTLDFLQDRQINIPTRHPYSEDRSFQANLLILKHAGIGFYHVVKNFFLCYVVARSQIGGTSFCWPHERQSQ